MKFGVSAMLYNRGNMSGFVPEARIFLLTLAYVVLCVGVSAAQTPTPTMSLPERLSASFASVAKAVEPAVVSIDTKSSVPEIAANGSPSAGNPNDIMEFFRRQLPNRPVYGVGSGFVVDPTGYIITNNHVIARATRITVKMDSGEEYPAVVVGTDEETDIAVLKIKSEKALPFVKLGDSDKPEVGDWVLALGSPFGLQKTVTAGIISQKGRESPGLSVFRKFIQTDAAINQGNSGGPLVNMDGEVIGVNSQIATSNGASNGIGFALPSNETLSVYKQIRANGRVRRGYLGARLDSVKSEFARVYGLKDAKGAIVTEVRDKTSAAGIAGLQSGDVILIFDGQIVENAADLISKVAATAPDQSVNIEYIRDAGQKVERKTVSLKLQERPSANGPTDNGNSRKMPLDGLKPSSNPFGLTLVEMTPAIAATYKLTGKNGLLVKEVNPASFIADVRMSTGEAALGEGDLIQRINRTDVKDLKSFGEIVGKLKAGDAVVLQVISYDARTASIQFKIVQFTVR